MVEDIFKASVEDFLTVTASDNPTPGGGSVAAVVGALGASLVQMVGNLTVGKDRYRDVEAEIQQMLVTGLGLMEKLKELAKSDIAHFDTFMKVLAMPKETSEQQVVRKKHIQQALMDATDTPLLIATTGVEVLTLSCRMAEIGNKMVVSDTGVAAYLAEAAVHSALITADSNLVLIEDRQFVDRANKEKQKISTEAIRLRAKTIQLMRINRLRG
ncbi:cyclodeaminase/cyclohydrolase family protein [Peptococcaceae bacterium]|nr:cyclodeaminase/cyclohydrolase family protein [Peptococcaceae bacterium]